MAVCLHNRQIKISQTFLCAYIHNIIMVILYQTAKLKSSHMIFLQWPFVTQLPNLIPTKIPVYTVIMYMRIPCTPSYTHLLSTMGHPPCGVSSVNLIPASSKVFGPTMLWVYSSSPVSPSQNVPLPRAVARSVIYHIHNIESVFHTHFLSSSVLPSSFKEFLYSHCWLSNCQTSNQ